MRNVLKGPWLAAAGLAAALFVGAPGAAHGQALQAFKFNSLNSTENLWFSDGSGAAAGRYNATVGTQAELIFCTDFTHHIGNPDNYDTLAALGDLTAAAANPATTDVNGEYYYKTPALNGLPGAGGGLISALSSTHDYNVTAGGYTFAERANLTAWLTESFLKANLTSTGYAGVQTAIWRIIQDGGGQITTTLGGKTLNTGSDAAIIASANYYLTLADPHKDQVLSDSLWVQSGSNGKDGDYRSQDHKQDFVYTTLDAPIPEPAFYQATALVALSGFGLLRMRRRKSAA